MQLFEIALDIPGVEIEKVETNKKGDIIITVKSTVVGTICHKCGRRITKAISGFLKSKMGVNSIRY